MSMSESEKDEVWREMVSRSNKRLRSGLKRVKREEKVVGKWERGGWREELVSDLKLLLIMFIVWFCFLGVVELTGAGGC